MAKSTTPKKKLVEVELVSDSIYTQSLEDFRNWLNTYVERVPAEFRNSIKVEVHSYEVNDYCSSSSYPHFKISYSRPETDDEETKRVAAEEAQRKVWEARELADLARLQAKYNKV
jgi:hypothetical protein